MHPGKSFWLLDALKNAKIDCSSMHLEAINGHSGIEAALPTAPSSTSQP